MNRTGEVVVVLQQQADRHLEVINPMKHQRAPRAIRFFRAEEMHRLLAPVPPRVEVVRGVVAVVEADAVALWYTSATKLSQRAANGFRAYHDVYHRDARPEI